MTRLNHLRTFVLLLPLVNLACVKRNYGNTALKNVNPTETISTACTESGSFSMIMHLHPDDMEASLTDTKLIDAEDLFPAEFVEFNMCGFDNGDALIKQVTAIDATPGAGAWTRGLNYLQPSDDSYKTLLGEAIGTGDYSKIEIKFLNSTKNLPSFLLKGWTKADGKSFLTLSAFNTKSTRILKVAKPADPSFKFIPAVYGQLQEGAVRDMAKQCEKTLRTKIYTAQNVNITLNFCYTGTYGQYQSYIFKKLILSDISTGENLQFNGEAEIAGVLTVQNSHHGLSDGLSIKTAAATYELAPNTADYGYHFSVKYSDNKFPAQDVKLTCSPMHKCGQDAAGSMQ